MAGTVLGPTDSLGGDCFHAAGKDNGGEGAETTPIQQSTFSERVRDRK